MKKIIGVFTLFLVFNSIILPAEISIHDAARTGDIDGIKNNIKFKDELDLSGERPIHCAARNLKIDAIRFLVSEGVFIDSATSTGLTSLHLVASLGTENDVIYLLQLSANVNLQDRLLQSALHYAVIYSNIPALSALLKNPDSYNKVNINLQNNLKQSALHLAVINGNLPIIDILLTAGINRNLTDQDGKTALQLALYLRGNGYSMNAIINALDPNFLALEAQQTQAQLQAAQVQFQLQLQMQEAQRQATIQSQLQQMYMQMLQQQQPVVQVPKSTVTIEEIQDLKQPTSSINTKKTIAPPPGFGHRTKQPSFDPVQQTGTDVSHSQNQEDPKQKFKQQEKPVVHKNAQNSAPKKLDKTEYPQLSSTEKVSTVAKPNSKANGTNSNLARVIQEIVSPQQPIKMSTVEVALEDKETEECKENDSADEEDEDTENLEVEDSEKVTTSVQEKKEKLSKHQQKKKIKAGPKKKKRVVKQKAQSPENISVETVQTIAEVISDNQVMQSIEEAEVELPETQEQEESQESVVVVKKKVVFPLHHAIRSKKPLDGLITLENVNTKDENDNGNLPLHLVVMEENLPVCQAIMQVILESGINQEDKISIINAINKSGFTALHYAVVKNNPEIADYLLSLGADFKLLSEKMQNKLIAMANKYKEGLFLRLDQFRTQSYTEPVEQAVATSSSCIGQQKESDSFQRPDTPINKPELHEDKEYKRFFNALIDGHMDTIEKSLEKHPEWLYVVTPYKLHTLHHAIMGDSNRDTKDLTTKTPRLVVTKYLISLDPKIIKFKEKKDHLSPFHCAIMIGHIEACIYLLSQLKKIENLDIQAFLKELINYCDITKESSFLTSQNPNFDKIKKILTNSLLAISGQIRQTDEVPKQEEKSKNQYLGCGKAELTKILDQMTTVYFFSKDSNTRKEIVNLIEAGADITEINAFESTYLHRFAAVDDWKLILKLVGKINTKIRNKEGNLALHNAASCGGLKSVICLGYYNRESINEQNNKGNTPLHVASAGGHLQVVQRLIKLGVDTQIKNKEGLTPYLLAIIKNQKECARLLYNYTLQKTNRTYQDVLEDFKNAVVLNPTKKAKLLQALQLYQKSLSSSSSTSSHSMTDEDQEFFAAIARGDSDKIESMLKENSKLLYSRNHNLQTPMHAVIISKVDQKKKDKMFNMFMLLDLKTAIERDKDNKTALHLAIDHQVDEVYLYSFLCYLALYPEVPLAQLINELKDYCIALKRDCEQEKQTYFDVCLKHLNNFAANMTSQVKALQFINKLLDE